MGVKLKRSLFIGLGGTGAKSLLHTKKKFIETYGEIPPMVSFLSIDTDSDLKDMFLEKDLNGYHRTQHGNQSDLIRFEKSELIHARVPNAVSAYMKNKDTIFSWVPEKNAHAIRNLESGAGQVRSNGRFALHFNNHKIIRSVELKINELLDIDIPADGKYDTNGSGIEINMVFSVGGGTGSGTFIDLAYLVKEAIGTGNNINTVAFLVMPDVFRLMGKGVSMANVKPNGYGALLDLDFLMQKNVDQLGLELNYEGKKIKIESNPFDIVFTVNNKNTGGQTVNDISVISEQIGLAMFTGSGELSSNAKSAYDNILAALSGGVLDVNNKRAWASGMGVSELFYDSQSLANIYCRKAMVELATNLITPDVDALDLADEFIDSENVLIRENNGYDYLIDSLLSKQSKIIFSTPDEKNEVQVLIDDFTNTTEERGKKEIEDNYEVRIRHVKGQLNSFVKTVSNKDSGIGNTIDFLRALNEQLSLFREEMTSEDQEFQDEWKNFNNLIKNDVKSWQNLGGFVGVFQPREVARLRDDSSSNVNRLSLVQNELLRRQFAVRFLNAIIAASKELQEKYVVLSNRLQAVKDRSSSYAIDVQNKLDVQNKTFVIPLHTSDLCRIKVDKDYSINDYVATLSGDGVHSFVGASEDFISDTMYQYVKGLTGAKKYFNATIEDVLNGMSTENVEKTIKELISKSNALWKWDFQGHRLNPEIHEDFIIGVRSKNSDIEDIIRKATGLEQVQFVATGIPNKVVCYRMEAAVPIYAVNDVRGYKADYKKSHISHHIDANWEKQMIRAGYSLEPSKKEDHSMEAWVLGFVFGLLKKRDFEDGKGIQYCVYNEAEEYALDDNFQPLYQAPYRDSAFERFKKEGLVDDLVNIIEKKRKEMGEEKNMILLKDAAENYLSNYSLCEMTSSELKKQEYKAVGDLLKKEITFIKKLV